MRLMLRILAGVVMIAFWFQSVTTFPGWLSDTAHDLSQHNGEPYIRLALVMAGLCAALVAIGPHRVGAWIAFFRPSAKSSELPPSSGSSSAPASSELTRAAQDEVVAMIDEGNAVRGGVFGAPDHGSSSIWRDKSAAFLGTVFGATERQRFLEASSFDGRLKWLADLRDRPDSWELQVDAAGLREAGAARRARSIQEQIVEAGRRDEPEPQPTPPAREDDLLRDLERLRRDGEQLTVRLSGQASAVTFLTLTPTQAVERWEERVVARLERAGEDELARYFRRTVVLQVAWESIFESAPQMPSAFDPHRELRRRVEARVRRLARIIRELERRDE